MDDRLAIAQILLTRIFVSGGKAFTEPLLRNDLIFAYCIVTDLHAATTVIIIIIIIQHCTSRWRATGPATSCPDDPRFNSRPEDRIS
jgi:hypothetical protein